MNLKMVCFFSSLDLPVKVFKCVSLDHSCATCKRVSVAARGERGCSAAPDWNVTLCHRGVTSRHVAVGSVLTTRISFEIFPIVRISNFAQPDSIFYWMWPESYIYTAVSSYNKIKIVALPYVRIDCAHLDLRTNCSQQVYFCAKNLNCHILLLQ